MNDENQALKFSLTVKASARAVYHAFTEAVVLQEWLCDFAVTDPVPEGKIFLAWNDGYAMTGRFLRLQPEEKVMFTWQGLGEQQPGEIKLSLNPVEDQLEIHLTHSKIGPGKAGKKLAKEFEKGWISAFENLKSVMESGVDLRLVNRPFLGVYGLEQVTAEFAQKFNLPVHHGMQILGVVEGGPAHAAGLQKDDVITRMDGEKLDNYQDFVRFIASHQAGTAIKVTYHRLGEKASTILELGRRPAPKTPESMEYLHDDIARNYSENQQILNNLLYKIKDSEATYRPGENDWNIKEVLAHLIILERDTQAWMNGILSGQETFDIVIHANKSERLAALISATPRCRSLQSELRRAQNETINLLKLILPKLVERKATYARLANNLTGFGSHLVEHTRQIEETVQSSRQPAGL